MSLLPASSTRVVRPTAAPDALRDTRNGGDARRVSLIELARGLACGAVLLFHSLAALPTESLHPVLRGLGMFTGFGWLGVHVFFALSGWCIAERLALAQRRGESPALFVCDRFWRIFPTYWAALAILFGLRWAALPFNHLPLAGSFPSGLRGWFADLFLLNPYLGEPPALIVSWSLVYELGFYACGALALGLRRQTRLASGWGLFVAGALLCFAPRILTDATAPWIVLGQWPDFFAGVAAWWIVRRRAYFTGAFLLVALLLSLFWPPSSERLGRSVAIGTAVALVFLHRRSERFCTSRPMRGLLWLGGISYSLYLIHIPLISPLQNLGTRLVSPSSAGFILVWLAMLFVAFFGGWGLNSLVEKPVQRWRHQHSVSCPRVS